MTLLFFVPQSISHIRFYPFSSLFRFYSCLFQCNTFVTFPYLFLGPSFHAFYTLSVHLLSLYSLYKLSVLEFCLRCYLFYIFCIIFHYSMRFNFSFALGAVFLATLLDAVNMPRLPGPYNQLHKRADDGPDNLRLRLIVKTPPTTALPGFNNNTVTFNGAGW